MVYRRFCHLSKEIRTFGLSRIQTAERKRKVFQIPDDFDFQKLSGSHFGVHWSDGNTNVKILFTKRVADYVQERTWHPSQKIVTCENGDVILTLTVNHLLELKRWILSWGCEAQVLEPDSLAKDIRQTLFKAVAIYDSKLRVCQS